MMDAAAEQAANRVAANGYSKCHRMTGRAVPAFALYYLQCTFTVFTTATSSSLKGSKVKVISRKDIKMKRGQVVWFVPNLYLPYKEALF